MKRFGRIIFFVILSLASLTAPAWANVDYLCLKQCVTGGTSSTNCMSQCTYESSTAPTPKVSSPSPSSLANPGSTSAAPLFPHRVLTAPVPLSDGIVLPAKQIAQPLSKDYACFSLCLKSGTPYKLCELHCTKVPCPSNEVMCASKGATGSTVINSEVGGMTGNSLTGGTPGLTTPH